MLMHAYATDPAEFMHHFSGVVSAYNKQGFGSRFEIDFPSLFGGQASLTEFNLTLEKEFTYKGKKSSLVSAKCPSSKKLKSNIAFTYQDG